MKILNYILFVSVIIIAVSCEKSESTTKSNQARLIKLSCSFGEGVMNADTSQVIVKAPEGTDITQIIPQFQISENATIYPASGVATDFSSPVNYTITSEDKSVVKVFKVIVIKPVVKFTVYDCSSWTPENMRTLQVGATIKVYTDGSKVGTSQTFDVLTTDSNGKATLYGSRSSNYYITVSKDAKSNIVNGFVLLGTYNSQVEVDSSPDPNAKVGGLRYMDVNGDGLLNNNDKANYQTIYSEDLVNANQVLESDLYIAAVN